MEILLALGSVAILIVAAIFVGNHFHQKRREAFEQEAMTHGFQYIEDDSPNFLPEFYLTNMGRNRRVHHHIEGEFDRLNFLFCDYKFTTGSGKHQRTSIQSVLVYSMDFDIPNFSLDPENMFHKIGSAFGYQDIDFTTHPKFSKAYLLRGPNELAIREFFCFEVLDYFERNQGLYVEAKDGHLLFYKRSSRIDPSNLTSFLMEGHETYRLLEQYSH
ncbi:MAG: hypothetical protein EP343_25150 [Deltaproteobacteria bacterium]|nr:MAG: hypothetical protein EP343_25150 [Deltaproteobacteria bacterium]